MTLLFFLITLIVCVILAFFVLIQNPQGGGLSSSIGGFSNQIMGVKKTNNVLERGTWLFVAILGVLCLLSVILLSGKASANNDNLRQLNSNVPAQNQTQQSVPAQPSK